MDWANWARETAFSYQQLKNECRRRLQTAVSGSLMRQRIKQRRKAFHIKRARTLALNVRRLAVLSLVLGALAVGGYLAREPLLALTQAYQAAPPAPAYDRLAYSAAPPVIFRLPTPPRIHIPEPPAFAVLNEADTARYRQVFALQKEAKWQQANAVKATIEDPVLMGYVQAQKLLHPKHFSTFEELTAWLKTYADHPQARVLYRLATQRKPRRYRGSIPRPDASRPLGYGDDNGLSTRLEHQYAGNTQFRKRPKARNVWQRVHRNIRQGRITTAYQYISSASHRKLFKPLEYDTALASIAMGYYVYGKDKEALEVARKSAGRSGADVPDAHWIAGISAWKLNQIPLAAKHFAKMAEAKNVSEWDTSTAAFWAYRAHYHLNERGKAKAFLEQAARYPRTFYGIIANRFLGRSVALNYTFPELDEASMRSLAKVPRLKRAMALHHIGQQEEAKEELRLAFYHHVEPHALGMLQLARSWRSPTLQVPMARYLQANENMTFDTALYPMPPEGIGKEYTVDPALVFAFIRQESGFYDRAESVRGARGMMQIMPSTAKFIARKTGLNYRRLDLFNPDHNIKLGQNYISYLLSLEDINHNLIYLGAAYNAGPTKLREWMREVNYFDDPLLFLESIPARETRNYVEQLLTQYWIYRQLHGKDTPSLDQLANGEWPIYPEKVGEMVSFTVAAREGD